jgi:hypothetical protein
MSFDFLDRRSAERFAELLDEKDGGHRHHNRGRADDDLAELAAIGHSLSAAKPGVRVDSEFRVGLRAMLVATAERDGIGRTATAVEDDPITAHAASVKSGARSGILGRSRRIRARGLIVAGVAASAMAVSGISAASENATPGDALYGVKRSTERAQLAMAGSDVTRGQLSLDFARNRLAEAAEMPGDAAKFGSVLDDMDADTRKGVKLLTTSAVSRKDVKPLNAVDTFGDTQRRVLTTALSKLSPVNRDRATASIGLLDDVRGRTSDLRDGLGCPTITSAGADTLGPKLRDCKVAADGASTTTRKPGHSGKATSKETGKNSKVSPERSGSAATPGATADTGGTDGSTLPDGQAPTAGTDDDVTPFGATTAPQTADPTTAPATDDDDQESGILGGLLGGIFGGN